MFKGEYKVGSKVYGCNFIHDVKLNGMAGEILAGMKPILTFHFRTLSLEYQYAYKVRWATGEVSAIAHQNLYLQAPEAGMMGWAQAKVARLFFPMPLLPK